MKWDLLLEWMTHTGSGSWGAFRDSVAELSDSAEPDVRGLAKRLRIVLSDLGHADFFVDNSNRWRALRPAIVGLARGDEYLFAGGWTRQLDERLGVHSRERSARLAIAEIEPGLPRISLAGDKETVRGLAGALGVEYVPDVSAFLASRLTPLRRVLELAPSCAEPINWDVHSWSFDRESWLPGKLRRTVRQYENRHGVRRYILDLGSSGLRELSKRDSIYAAALLKGIRIVKYSHESLVLSVPWWAPLPESYSRATCLAGGRVAIARGNELVFESVPPHVASLLLVGLGQTGTAGRATP